jgi:hypothetical protein
VEHFAIMTKVYARCLTILCLFVLIAAALPAYANTFNPSVCANYEPGNGEVSKACQDMMKAFPKPVVIPAPKDSYTLSNYSFWQVTHESPNLYDSPNGNVISQMPGGFNFVRAINTSAEGWVRIESGEWMSADDIKYHQASFFTGVTLLDGLQHPFAWVLGDLVTVPEPGASQSLETGRYVARYSLVNLFAEAEGPDGWNWYMIGPDEWIEQRSLSIAKRIERPEDVSGRWVAVDLYEQTLIAYEDDTPVFATLISSGLPGWDTNEGLFNVWAKLPADRMAGATGAPDAYALQSVPWVMYFDDAISLHGTYWHDGFGYRHSHGCVNLSISDARYLFEWFSAAEEPVNEDDEVLNYVYVYSSGEYRKSGSATK